MGLVGLSDAGEPSPGAANLGLAAWVLPGGRPMLAAKEQRFATDRAIFRGYHSAIPLTVAYSAIFVTVGQGKHGESDEGLTANDAKYGFGQLIDLAPRRWPSPSMAGPLSW